MNKIPRKAVAQPAAIDPAPESYDILDDLLDDYLEPSPRLVRTTSAVDVTKHSPVVSISPHLGPPSPALRSQKSTPSLVTRSTELSVVSTTSNSETVVSSSSRWKTVVDETIYFAGGLISHPFESSKHYSILRHSSAIVYYKGPSTNVTISIFGDSSLPPDRTFWVQRKGFSGNMGMAASALMRTTSNWIDVTPSAEALASHVPESDERAWQRDIKKFLKKASKDKRLSKHLLRETCVLRMPASVDDGYLRIVMCAGQSSKKSLCPSPTFRLASTSSDVSVLRGASLATMPIEAGLKVASVVGNAYVQRVMGPAQAVVQSRIKTVQTKVVGKHTERVAVARAGVGQQFGTFEAQFDAARDVTYDPFHEEGSLDEPPDVIGSDAGPEKPFPVKLSGRVVRGTGRSWSQTGIPTANLSGVAEDILLRLNGIYIGWAAVDKGAWREAIVTIAPSPYVAPTVVQRKLASVHIIHDFGEGMTFFDARLKVIVMAYLRPAPKPALSGLYTVPEALAAISRDREIVIASLSREMWRPESCLETMSAEKAQRSMTDRYVGMRAQVQRRVDSLPVHVAGIRTERAGVRDGAFGQGGFYIRR
ncbi:hypothetical protein F4808DRAFT_125441 [Astrocystis sublimbata]|nr:hypothetical protein F4808DRAFT_125441 [Astrocystis sublimbata]